MPLALAITSTGAPDLNNALRALRCLFLSPREEDLRPRNSEVLRYMITYAYTAGVIGAMIGWIQILMAGIETGNMPLAFAVSMLTIFYSVIIAECILRPAARRIEGGLQENAG
jgi:flagellar motor component MotA